MYHEAVGRAEVEFFAAPGNHTIFDPEVFRLVGQREIGAGRIHLLHDGRMAGKAPRESPMRK